MFLAHIVKLVRMWRRYDQSVRELSRLDERELADIGLSRGDIPAAAFKAAESAA